MLSKIRWPRNSYEILQEFRSKFWWQALVSNNSNDYQILQEIDDHGILMKFQDNFDQNSFQEIDDYGILMKFFKDFYQNSGGHP